VFNSRLHNGRDGSDCQQHQHWRRTAATGPERTRSWLRGTWVMMGVAMQMARRWTLAVMFVVRAVARNLRPVFTRAVTGHERSEPIGERSSLAEEQQQRDLPGAWSPQSTVHSHSRRRVRFPAALPRFSTRRIWRDRSRLGPLRPDPQSSTPRQASPAVQRSPARNQRPTGNSVE